MPIKLVAIIPKNLYNDKAIFFSLQRQAIREIRIIDDLYSKTYRTWKSKPGFQITNATNRQKISVRTGSNDDKMFWLDDGTRVRWALMSPDWVSKTRPRAIGSRGGSGRVIIAGKRAMIARGIGPRPGIKARQFTREIVVRRQKPYTKAMTRALRKGLAAVKPFRP